MGRRIAPLAVRVPRIVVSVGAVFRDELLQHGLEVIKQRALKLVDEESAGGVARIHEHDPLNNARTEHAVPHLAGNVNDLDPLLAQHREGLPDYLKGHSTQMSFSGMLTGGTDPASLMAYGGRTEVDRHRRRGGSRPRSRSETTRPTQCAGGQLRIV